MLSTEGWVKVDNGLKPSWEQRGTPKTWTASGTTSHSILDVRSNPGTSVTHLHQVWGFAHMGEHHGTSSIFSKPSGCCPSLVRMPASVVCSIHRRCGAPGAAAEPWGGAGRFDLEVGSISSPGFLWWVA